MTEANDAMHWCKINSVETDNRIAGWGCILVDYVYVKQFEAILWGAVIRYNVIEYMVIKYMFFS